MTELERRPADFIDLTSPWRFFAHEWRVFKWTWRRMAKRDKLQRQRAWRSLGRALRAV